MLARLTPAQHEELERRMYEAGQVEFHHQQFEQRDWEEVQRAKAPAVLALLQAHVPAERWSEVKEFLSTGYGRDCLGEILEGRSGP
jgi:hypothetical protein